MKQALQLRMGQQLAMTAQLQQSIRLLQLSTMDLQLEIQNALESNMMLELAEEESESSVNFEANIQLTLEEIELPISEISVNEIEPDIPQELALDCDWEDIYQEALSQTMHEFDPEFDTEPTRQQSLTDYLLEQLLLIHLSERDQTIALAIIDAINSDGYLTQPLMNLYQDLTPQFPDLDLEEVTTILHMIQSFEPNGVAALDLKDCLKIQLLQLPESTPYRQSALE
ncbi:MAG: hypothetical protein RL637_285, partial [Pseudomonadota bacterium]